MLLATDSKITAIEAIVIKACSLTERLSLASIYDTVPDDEKIQERLQKWCDTVAQGDFEKFEQRLAWDELDIDRIIPLLTDSQSGLSLPERLPSWATILERVIDKAKSLSPQQQFASQRYLDPQELVPFEPIYVPCLLVARERLTTQLGDRLSLLTESAQAALERQLLLQLSEVCLATLMAEFSEFRSSGNTTRDFVLFQTVNRDRQEKYSAFIAQLFEDGLLPLFEKYSVLGKLLAIKIELWVEATAEFIDRLARDWSEIELNFSPKQSLKQVTELKLGLSDSHNGGKSITILTFDTGKKIVYKPKKLDIDVAFYELLDWFNSQKAILDFRVLQVLNCDTYGWVECVEHSPCPDLAAVERFYQRAGILLCLVYLLGGTDCHYENIIASGEHPALIDLETLLQHRIKDFTQSTIDAEKLAKIQLEQSVLQTYILPGWEQLEQSGLKIDVSGLGGKQEQEFFARKAKNINSDGMCFGDDLFAFKQTNLPTLRGEYLSLQNYLPDIVRGFRQMYDFLQARREVLLDLDSPLTNLVEQKVRFLFRPTKVYKKILDSSLTPSFLKSGIDRSIKLDILSRNFLAEDKKPASWSILHAEVRAMEQLDIPFFLANASQMSLQLSKEVTIPELFKESSYEDLIRRLKSLGTADLARQLEIIHGSFCARFAAEPDAAASSHPDSSSFLTKHTALTPEQLVQEAISLAQELQQRGIYADDSVTWIGLAFESSFQSFRLQSLGHNLYDGSSGVALFLAAIAKVTGNSEWRSLALRTLQPLRSELQNSSTRAREKLKRIGIGGATGLGSIVYALVQTGLLLQDADLIESAKKAASLVTLELINGDRRFDLLDGASGTILALIKLDRTQVDSTYLEQAVICGEYLLQQQTEIANYLTTGFSQGAAGIAYALSQLFAVTQDSRFLEAAKKAIAFEQSYLSSSKELVLRNSWANGAAGIGLGRLGSLPSLDTAAIRQEIGYALKTTQNYCIEDIDNLAWGNLGRIETLLVASQRLDSPALLDFGLKATTHIVRQAQLQGKYNLCSGSVPAVYNPGFFQGTAGIGYQLLRTAYPHLLPSVLLWQ